MHTVIAIVEVESVEKFKEGFQTHGELFKSQTISSPIRFGAGKDGKEISIAFEVEDLDLYQKILESPETAEAMAQDGVNKETVKFFVLDQECAF